MGRSSTMTTSVWGISKSAFETRKKTSSVDSTSTGSKRGRSMEGTNMTLKRWSKKLCPSYSFISLQFSKKPDSHTEDQRLGGRAESESELLILSENKKAC